MSELSAESANFAWLPILLAVAICLFFAGSVATVWLINRGSTKQKVFRTISIVIWAIIFCGLEGALAWFASVDAAGESRTRFVLCCCCIGAGGALCACAKSKFEVFTEQKLDQLTGQRVDCETDQGDGQAAAQSVNLSFRPRKSITKNPNKLQSILRIIHTSLLWAVSLLGIAGVTLLCYMLIEMPSNSNWANIDGPYLKCELLVIMGVVAGAWFIFQRRPIGLIIPLVIAFVYGIAEYFVEYFKTAAITPSDLRSMSTGLSVAGGYEYELTASILICMAFFALALGALVWIRDPLARFLSKLECTRSGNVAPFDSAVSNGALVDQSEKDRKIEKTTYFVKQLAVALVSVVLGAFVMFVPIKAALEMDWEEKGLELNFWRMDDSVNSYGLITSFIYELQLEDLDEPQGYSQEQAEGLQAEMALLYDQSVGNDSERIQVCKQFENVKPNVVIVMNETFSDLSSLGGLGVGYEGPTFIRNMNAIAKGSTDVSVYGGGTCNSEFEALTGTSLGLVGGGVAPYALYDLSFLDTIPKQFKAMGYETTAIHPEAATNWGRDDVYPAIGFDTFLDQTYFTDSERSREHVVDEATYQKVMEVLRDNDSPQFVFDLTMMGHSGYETGLISQEENVNYDFSGIVDENEGAITNEYLSSIRMSDEDVQAFIEELEDFDEPVVLVFFGDHQPNFSWWFRDRFVDDESDINFQESIYETEYFVWANYDVGKTAVEDGAVAETVSESSTSAAATANVGLSDGLQTERSAYPKTEEDLVEYRGAMSPASLMSWTLSYIGAPLTDYQKANFISRYWLMSNNVYGYRDAAGRWHPMQEAKAVDGEDVFAQGMNVVDQVLQSGSLPSEGEILQEEPEVIEIPSVAGKSVAIGEAPAVFGTDVSGTAEEEEATNDEASTNTRAYQDAVMVNVMRWLAYLNFSALIK